MRYYIIALIVIFFDQATKILTKSYMNIHESIEILGSYVRLTFIKNPGMAFGIRFESILGIQNGKIIFTIFSIIASVVIFIYLLKTKGYKKFVKTALAFILGGAIGNLIDRMLFGSVVDFVDVGIGELRWPVFNVADSAVTIGMIILIAVILFEKKPEPVEQISQPESSI